METDNKELNPQTAQDDIPAKPSMQRHIIFGVMLSIIITPVSAILLMTTLFQIRLAKYNIKQGKEAKIQWRNAILTIFLVFAIMAILVISALMAL